MIKIQSRKIPSKPRSKDYIGYNSSSVVYSSGSSSSSNSGGGGGSVAVDTVYKMYSWSTIADKTILELSQGTKLAGELLQVDSTGVVVAQAFVEINTESTSNNYIRCGHCFDLFYVVRLENGNQAIYTTGNNQQLYFYGYIDGGTVTVGEYKDSTKVEPGASNVIKPYIRLTDAEIEIDGVSEINAPVDITTGTITPSINNSESVGTDSLRYKSIYAKTHIGSEFVAGSTSMREGGVYSDSVVSSAYGVGRGYRLSQLDGLECGGLDTSEIAFDGAVQSFVDVEEPSEESFRVVARCTIESSVDGLMYFRCGSTYEQQSTEDFDLTGSVAYAVAGPPSSWRMLRDHGNGLYSIKTFAGKFVYNIAYYGTFSRSIKRPNPNIAYSVPLIDIDFYISGNGSTDGTTMYEGLNKSGKVDADGVVVINALKGYKVTSDGVYNTTDGGENWNKLI